jgi:hypothetical protein
MRIKRVWIAASDAGYPSCDVNRANSAASDATARLMMCCDMEVA